MTTRNRWTRLGHTSHLISAPVRLQSAECNVVDDHSSLPRELPTGFVATADENFNMSDNSNSRQPLLIQFLYENSLFLILGAFGALVWANVDSESHHNFFHFDLTKIVSGDDGDVANGSVDREHAEDADSATGQSDDVDPAVEEEDGEADDGDEVHGDDEAHGHGFSFYFIINDILMAFFFAIAAKEVWESLLPGGALSNPRKAATPLLATLGGILGPVVVYCTGVWLCAGNSILTPDQAAGMYNGWAIPCATDIAFSYLVARIVFGAGHPAIAFLLLLAIADDAVGLIILAVFYPQGDLAPTWLLLTVAAIIVGFFFQKTLKLHSFWWYLLIPGTMSWFSFYNCGIHAALGLVPIIPCLPHGHTDLGIFAKQELKRHDTLNEFEHWWKNPVELFLGFFGLCNAGVAFSSMGPATWFVLAGLLIGKPVGITLMTLISDKLFGLEIPKGMGYAHVVTLGCMAGIGFTVALFVSTAAFAGSEFLDSAKMGALFSFGAAFISVIVGRALGIKPLKETE